MPTLAELIAERERRRAVAASASGETVPAPPASGGVAMEALIAERERRRTGQPAPMPQPDVAPWGDGQAFDDLYARRPQKDPLLSPLRPEARTLTAGQSTQMKPPPAPRGPVMSPAQRRATQEERDAGRRDRLARDERTVFNSASPGLAFRDTGAQGTVELNTDGGDIGRGVIASPIHAQRAAVSAAEAMLNTPADLASVATVPFAMGMDPASQGIVANLEFARDEASVANAMDRFANRYEQGGFRDMQEKLDAGPRFDFSAAKLPVPEDLQSLSGALAEGFMQYLIARGAVGKFAPGGKLPVQLAEDTAAVGVGYSGETGRAADMLDPETMGFMKDYVRWLQSQPGESAGMGRFKNMAEDATINLLAMGLFRGGQAVTDTLTPQALTPTNAGGARPGAVNTAAVQPPPTTAVPTFTRPQTAPPLVQPQAAQRAPTQPQVATAPPVAQTTPNAPAATVASPQPVPVTGAAPPAGQLTPVPALGPAEQAYNNLPMKTRESMLNAFQSAGVEANRAKAMISELNNLPDGQNTMYALEIMRRNGLTDADIDGVLIAMGREFATESPRPAGRVFNREQDSARQIMNDQVRTQINSEGRSITDVAERNFGQGVVPAGEALDLELDQLSNAYETILSTKRSPTGRLRSPAKKDAVYKAREELTNALVSPEVMQTIPPDVKLQIMMQASEDMRRLKFTPDELGLILQGDGKVLAPLFNGYGALSWSPDLWAHLARQYPTQAAHSLQSALRKAADEAFRRGDATWGRYYKRLRGESGKGGLLDTLERAVPKYRETRLKFGDASSAKEALDILERFKAAAASEGDVAKIIKDLEVLPQRHREMAEQQITSIVRQELARKVESPRLAELGQSVAQTPNLTSLSRQDFLKALEDVFGPRGKELADAIRAARARTDTLTSISPKYNSRTEVNRQDVQNAPALYEAPGSLEGGIIDAGVKRLGTVAGGASLIPGGQGAALALGAATAVQAAMNAARRGKRLSNAERNALVDFLFRSRTADDAAPAMATRGPSMGDYAQAIGRDAAIGAGVGAVADGDPLNNDPMALVGGALGGAAGYGRARVRNARSLIKPPPAPRGAGRRNPPPAPRTPPGAPPVQSGFGGGRKLPMDEASRMARAREMGFDVDTPLYHGTGANFDSFRVSETGLSGRGVYLTSSPKMAQEYAPKDGGKVMSVFLRGKIAGPDEIRQASQQVERAGFSGRKVDAVHKLLADRGYTGAKYQWTSRDETVVFDPANIRRTDATFDPSESSSSKLLAGTGANATGLGGAGGAVAGYIGNPVDANRDGVINDDDRGLNAMGGLVSGLVGGGLAGAGANRLLGPRRGVSKAAAKGPEQQRSVITRYSFDAPKGIRVELGIEPTGHVHFSTPSQKFATGVGGSQGSGQFSGVEARQMFRQMLAKISEDAQATGRARYILEPQDQRMQAIVRFAEPPAGYEARPTQWGVEFVRSPKAGPQKLRTGPGFGTEADYLRAVKEGDDAFRASAEKITQAGGFGDYKVSLRYPIDSELRGASFNVTKNGEVVGTFDLYSPGHTQELSLHAMVKPEFQRQGIATQFYEFVERTTGKRLRKSETMSPEGKALWDARERRSAPQKPPAQSGFGGGSPKPPPGIPPKAKPKAPSTIMGSAVGRAATGGVVGGAVGALAGEADPQTPKTAQKIAENDTQIKNQLAQIAEFESALKIFSDGTPEEIQAQLDREGFDLGPTGIDGTLGEITKAAIRGRKNELNASLKTARERLATLENDRDKLKADAAFEKTRPTEEQLMFRDYAPLLGGIAGAAGAKIARVAGTTVSKFTAKSAIKKANALLNNAPIAKPRTAQDFADIEARAFNINEFWKRGGANQPENLKQLLRIQPKRSVPFESKKGGSVVARPLAKVLPPDELFPDRFVGRKIGAMDALIGGSAATEAVLAAQNAEMIKEKLNTARQALEKEKSEENYARVEELEDQYAQAKALMMLGIGAGVGTGLGVAFTKYASKRADVPKAEQELAILRQYFANQQKTAGKAAPKATGKRGSKKPPPMPPLPPSRPRRNQRPPKP